MVTNEQERKTKQTSDYDPTLSDTSLGTKKGPPAYPGYRKSSLSQADINNLPNIMGPLDRSIKNFDPRTQAMLMLRSELYKKAL